MAENNKVGDVFPRQEEDQLTVESWDERWHQGRTGFHRDYVDSVLKRHMDLLTSGRKGIRIFLPMCGKTLDMKWLADLGYTVIGVEYSELAIKTFSEEQNVEFTQQSVDGIKNCTLYKSKDEKIQIYQCDFYDFSSEIIGQVDAIWDRGAFSAIMYKHRQKYVDVIVSLMKADTKYILITVLYDTSIMTAPPYCIPVEEVQYTFGDKCTVTKIAEYEEDREIWKKKGHKYFTNIVQLLTLKISQ